MAKKMDDLNNDAERELIYQETIKKVARLDDPVELMETTGAGLHLLLQDATESPLLDRLSVDLGAIVGALPFESPQDEMRQLTLQAAQRCLILLQAAHDRQSASTPLPTPVPDLTPYEDQLWEAHSQDIPEREIPDIEYYLPPPFSPSLGSYHLRNPQDCSPGDDIRQF